VQPSDFRCRIDFKCKAGWEHYFLNTADKQATLKKYPPKVLAGIIADGVEAQILSGEFQRWMEARVPSK
jgi:hypothetical protein